MERHGGSVPQPAAAHVAERLEATLDLVTRGVEAILTLLVALLVALLFAQVVFRYAVNAPIMWAEQLARWVFVWITFLAASIVYRRGYHIAIDAFVSWLPLRMRQAIGVVNHLLIAAFLVIFGYYGYLLAMGTRGQVFGSLQLPPSYIYMAAPVASVLMLLFTLEKAVNGWSGRPNQPAPTYVDAAPTADEVRR